jgi:hypothetical protein
VDRAFLYFDVKADLTTVFNWNVKQLFLFVVCEYETRTNTLNQVVIWDKIVTEEENAKIDLTEVPNKYYLTDHADELRYDLASYSCYAHTWSLCCCLCRVPPPGAAPLATPPPASPPAPPPTSFLPRPLSPPPRPTVDANEDETNRDIRWCSNGDITGTSNP